MMYAVKIDRNLDLSLNNDRDHFYDLLQSSKELPFTIEEIQRCVDFLLTHLKQKEWLKIYPVPSIWGNISIGLKVGKSHSQSLDFFYHVIPLAKNLSRLKCLENFDIILKRLDIPSHERLSTILEVQIAANYQDIGYKVELQPENGKGGLCDIRICVEDGNEWIYIECKVPSINDSQFLQRRQKVILDLENTILERTKPFLPSTHRIEIQFSSKFKRQRSYKWLEEIVHSLKNKEFESWKESSGIRYCINPIKNQLIIHTYVIGTVRIPDYPTSLSGSGVHIWYSIGNIAKNLINLIKDARAQLPDTQRGIIVIKSDNIALIESKMGEMIKTADYKRIIGIVALDETHAFIFKNSDHIDIPSSMLNTVTHKCT